MAEIYPKWRDRPVIPSYHAYKEMEGRFDLFDVVEILENGVECKKSRRGKGTVERCIERKGKIIKVVAVKTRSNWTGGDVWLIKHVGD